MGHLREKEGMEQGSPIVPFLAAKSSALSSTILPVAVRRSDEDAEYSFSSCNTQENKTKQLEYQYVYASG